MTDGESQAFSQKIRIFPVSRSLLAAGFAQETWLGPVADDIAAAAELSDAELDRKLRSGKFGPPGSSARIEKIMAEDMERPYRGN